jgi:uncharacterized membrane protein
MARPMKHIVIAYLATLIALVAIDFVWLSFMAERLYRPVMGDILLSEFKLAPAVLFYLLYAAGTVFLAVRPGLAANSPVTTLAHGAALGFTAYATYDLTNQATLKNWSLTLTIADIMWGTCLTAVAAGFALQVVRRLSRSDIPGGRTR